MLDAAALAQELGDTDRLCRALLASSRGHYSQTGAVDYEGARALEGAAEVLPNDDPRRGQVLALLANELHYTREPARCRALATEAIEIARVAGDPYALAYTLANAIWALGAPDTLPERIRVSDELIELAQRLDDPRLSFWAGLVSANVGTEAGDRPRVESGLTTMRALAVAVPEPSLAFLLLLYESTRAIDQGELETAERLARQMFEVGTASGQPDAVTLRNSALAMIRWCQGRAGELVEYLVRLAGKPASLAGWRSAAAGALIESGREDEARALALAEDFQAIPRDRFWLHIEAAWAESCCRLGLVDRAGELYELLAPFPRQLAMSGNGVVGSVASVLGTLATTLQRYDQADAHFAAGAKIEERFGAPHLLAHTRAGWARALIARGRPEDLDRAAHMLEHAEETEERLGLAMRDVAECREALAAING